MKFNLKATTSLILGAAVVGSFASSALATTSANNRTVPAITGRADTPSDDSCFSGSWNGVVNTCSTARRWDVPIPVDPNYGLTMSPAEQLVVSGAASNVSCQAQAVSSDYMTVSTTGWWPAGGVSDTGARTVSPGTITVPTYTTLVGTASLACFIPHGTVFGAVQY